MNIRFCTFFVLEKVAHSNLFQLFLVVLRYKINRYEDILHKIGLSANSSASIMESYFSLIYRNLMNEYLRN